MYERLFFFLHVGIEVLQSCEQSRFLHGTKNQLPSPSPSKCCTNANPKFNFSSHKHTFWLLLCSINCCVLESASSFQHQPEQTNQKKKKKAQRTATVRERFMQSLSAEELIGDFFFQPLIWVKMKQLKVFVGFLCVQNRDITVLLSSMTTDIWRDIE